MSKRDNANARLKKWSDDFKRKMDRHSLAFRPYKDRIPEELDDETLLAIHDILWNRAGSCRRTAVLEEKEGEKRSAEYWHTTASTFGHACDEIRRLLNGKMYFDERRERWSLEKNRRIVWVPNKR